MKLNRNEVILLQLLAKSDCDNEVRAITIRKISESMGISYYSVRTMIHGLVSSGTCAEGCKDGRSVTYYITDKGKNELNKLT